MRFGVVLLVPPPTAHEVDGLRRAFVDPALDRVPPHVTLVPPVNVRAEDVAITLQGLRAAVAEVLTAPTHARSTAGASRATRASCTSR